MQLHAGMAKQTKGCHVEFRACLRPWLALWLVGWLVSWLHSCHIPFVRTRMQSWQKARKRVLVNRCRSTELKHWK